MEDKIEEINKKILKEFPERYYKVETDRYSNIIITDVLNTEPVCLIYGRYHPYAVDLILGCLRGNHEEEIGRRRGEERNKRMPYPYYDNKGILDELEKWVCKRLHIKRLGDAIGPSIREDVEIAGILAIHSKIIELKKEHQVKEGKHYGSTPF